MPDIYELQKGPKNRKNPCYNDSVKNKGSFEILLWYIRKL